MPEAASNSTMSTATVAPKKQFAYWREAVCETFLRLQVERENQACFRGEITSSKLGVVKLHRVNAQPLAVSLTSRDLRYRDRDCLYVNFQTVGESQVRQNGRYSRVQAGQWYVLDGMAPFELEYSRDFATLNFEMPREVFRARIGDEAAVAGSVFGVSGGAERFLRDVAHSLSVEAAHFSDEQAVGASSLFLDMLNLALLRPQSDMTGSGSSRRLKVERFIRQNLENPTLSAVAIAKGCNMSLRTLHSTFANSGETIMQYVRGCRMRSAAHLLSTEAKDRSITEIAYETGFKDSASFSRAFRQNFGVTPREYRSGGR